LSLSLDIIVICKVMTMTPETNAIINELLLADIIQTSNHTNTISTNKISILSGKNKHKLLNYLLRKK
jgi:hypothetical protein